MPATPSSAPARPGPLAALVRALASGLGVGYLPVAPGTFGTLLGFPLWWALSRSPLGLLAGAIVAAALAVPICAAAERSWGETDPSRAVLDEIVAVPICLLPYTPGAAPLPALVMAFLLFRLFDVTKPPPIFQAQRAPGGLGVVLDDLLAGVYTCLILLFLRWIRVPGF